MQARKVAQTPEELKQERETHKAENAVLRRKATPRKKKGEEDKVADKQDGEGVHTSESDADTTDGEKGQEESTVDNNREEVKRSSESTEMASNRQDNEQLTVIQQDKLMELKEQEFTPHVNIESSTPQTTEDASIENKKAKVEDSAPIDTKLREQDLVRVYNQLWESENQVREVLNSFISVLCTK
jgi:hypothetical protein